MTNLDETAIRELRRHPLYLETWRAIVPSDSGDEDLSPIVEKLITERRAMIHAHSIPRYDPVGYAAARQAYADNDVLQYFPK